MTGIVFHTCWILSSDICANQLGRFVSFEWIQIPRPVYSFHRCILLSDHDPGRFSSMHRRGLVTSNTFTRTTEGGIHRSANQLVNWNAPPHKNVVQEFPEVMPESPIPLLHKTSLVLRGIMSGVWTETGHLCWYCWWMQWCHGSWIVGLATFSLFGLPFLLSSIPFMTPPLLLSSLGALPPGSPSPSRW